MNVVACIVFMAVVGCMIAIAVHRTGEAVNAFSVFAFPYLLLVPLNQFVAVPLCGFFEVSSEVLLMIGSAMLFFLLGFLVFSKPRIDCCDNCSDTYPTINERLDQYNTRTMGVFVLAIGAICILRVVSVVAFSDFDLSLFDDEVGSFAGGVTGHLNLIACSLVPILTIHAYKHRDWISAAAVSATYVYAFASLIKNIVLGLLVATVLFIAINDPKKQVRVFALLIMGAIVLFIFNYWVGFFARGSEASASFYLQHFFLYSTGSLVHDNYIFTSDVDLGIGLFEKMATFVFALPNMFLGKAFGFTLFPYVGHPLRLVSSTGELSNVMDAIGYLFPANGDAAEIVLFLVVFSGLGLFTGAFTRFLFRVNNRRFSTALAFYLTYFCFFSFFGTFYVSSTPWELIVWCAIMPRLFFKQTQGSTGILQNHRESKKDYSVEYEDH